MADERHNRPWLDGDAVSVLGDQHRLPKNPEKWLPKFNPDDKILVEDHLKSFMQAIRLRTSYMKMWFADYSLTHSREELLPGTLP